MLQCDCRGSPREYSDGQRQTAHHIRYVLLVHGAFHVAVPAAAAVQLRSANRQLSAKQNVQREWVSASRVRTPFAYVTLVTKDL